MNAGTRVTSTDSKWTGTVLEIKDTPNGQSVKVQRDDRKIGSWYWLSQIRPMTLAERTGL